MPNEPAILVILSIVASGMFVVHANLFTYAEEHPDSKWYKLIRVAALGLLFASGGCDVAALNFGPLSLKAPLGVINIAINPFVARIINKRPIRRVENLVLAVFGCLMCILVESRDIPAPTFNEIRSQWHGVGVPIYVGILCGLSVSFTLISLCSMCCDRNSLCSQVIEPGSRCAICCGMDNETKVDPKHMKGPWISCAKSSTLFNLIAAGLYSSITTLLISTIFGLGETATEHEIGLTVFFIVVTALAYLVHLNRAFATREYLEIHDQDLEEEKHLKIVYQESSALHMALFTVINIGANVLNGGIVNGDFAHFNAVQSVIFAFGLALALFAVTLF